MVMNKSKSRRGGGYIDKDTQFKSKRIFQTWPMTKNRAGLCKNDNNDNKIFIVNYIFNLPTYGSSKAKDL